MPQPQGWSQTLFMPPYSSLDSDVGHLGSAAGVHGRTQLAAIAEGVEEAAVARGAWVTARYLVSQTGLVQSYTATRGAWFASFWIEHLQGCRSMGLQRQIQGPHLPRSKWDGSGT